ncbi:MAG: HTH-type transcriptional regulator BhcR [Alkalilacustris sp.]
MPDAPRRGRPRAFDDRTEANTVRALDRGIALLSHLAAAEGLTLTDLSKAAGEAPATVYRALVTLEQHGVVELDPAGQHWHVGAGAFRIGSAFLRRTKVAERARAPMQDLMRTTGETANLGIETDDQVLFLTQIETHEAIRAFFPPGMKSPMHVSGIGKALLAYFPPDRVARIVARKGLAGFTARSLTEPDRLMADLAATRARGHAIDDEERAEGMRCVAAPVFNVYGEPVAALSVSGPAFRMTLARADAIGAHVRAAADTVTTAIGGARPGAH